MAPGRRTRVGDGDDADALLDATVRLPFDAPPEEPSPRDSPAPAPARGKNWSILGERGRGALFGAAAATAALCVAPTLAVASDDPAVDLVFAPIRWCLRATWTLCSSSGGLDPVDRFLESVALSEYAEAFRATGYRDTADFFGVSERELADDIGVAFPAHRRRIVRRAEALQAAAAFWALAPTAVLTAAAVVALIVVAAVTVALSLDERLRARAGAYVGIAGAIGWYWGKQLLEGKTTFLPAGFLPRLGFANFGRLATSMPRLRFSASGKHVVEVHRDRRLGNSRRASVGENTRLETAGSGTDDDDSAFEGSRQGSPGGSGGSLAAELPPGLVEAPCDDLAPEDVPALLERWCAEELFVSARSELVTWHASREDYPRYEQTLAALKERVPESEVRAADPKMAIGGDYDNMYRRFLSAQGGRLAKAETMLRKTMHWRSTTDLEGKMRVWKSIPAELKNATFDGYQSGWYSTHTSIGCPVYIERTGLLHLNQVLKHVSAEDVVNHHLRMMEWMMRVLMPEMAKREGLPAPDKVVNLLDMQGLSTRVLSRASMSIFRRVVAIDQTYFPEIMYRCYIVNCPTVFRAVWSVVKPLLDKRIQKKIKIYGKVTGKVMDEMIAVFGGKERVPSFIGGGGKRTLKQCPPWNLTHMDDDAFISWETPVRPESSRGNPSDGIASWRGDVGAPSTPEAAVDAAVVDK